LVPKPVARVYFATYHSDTNEGYRDLDEKRDNASGRDEDGDEDDETEVMLTQIEEDILDVFGDAYLNKHLVYNILDLVLVRVVPEMGEKGVRELMEERGVVFGNREGGEDSVEKDEGGVS
jgi:hypothetical protein